MRRTAKRKPSAIENRVGLRKKDRIDPAFFLNLRVPGRIRTDDIQNHNLTL